jgi:hypothetical protein
VPGGDVVCDADDRTSCKILLTMGPGSGCSLRGGNWKTGIEGEGGAAGAPPGHRAF